MPAIYAHHRLGQQARALLSQPEAELLKEQAELFAIGLQGPDILFHYKPLGAHPVNRLGTQIHERPGADFFLRAGEVLRRRGEDMAGAAYLCGAVCHFVLDVYCHGYVEETAAQGEVSHTEIETDFDRWLLCRDGQDPLRCRPARVLVPSQDNGAVIAPFYEGTTPAQVRRGIAGMRRDSALLAASFWGTRLLVRAGMKLAGKDQNFRGLLMTRRENPNCRESTRQLWERYQQAVPKAAALMAEYLRFLAEGGALDPLYQEPFVPRAVPSPA